MATTALQIEKDGKIERIYFMTTPKENGEVDVDIFIADDDWIPQGTPSIGYAPMGEEQYHTELRVLAIEKNQYVPYQSTNPEWNPGYNPEDYDYDKLLEDTDLNESL